MKEQRYELKKYVDLLGGHNLAKQADVIKDHLSRTVEYLSYDSNDVTEGTLFVCKGAHFSPKYLADAVKRGAFCYISEVDYGIEFEGLQVSCILVSDIRKAMPLLADLFYGQAWKSLKLIGITGTKGKSTTTYYVKSIIDQYQKAIGKPESAIISGIDNYDGVIREESHLTTPEAMMFHRHMRHAVDSGIEYLQMEVSSQALKYDRVSGVTFDVGCYLNIGEDHISPIEHDSFDDYFESKLVLFRQSKIGCVNMDADHWQEVADIAREHCEKLVTFSTSDQSASIYCTRIVKEDSYTSFYVKGEGIDREFRLTMPGLFNVENALAAIAICTSLGIPEQHIYNGLFDARVAGRMEVYEDPRTKALVIVDYAHNKMSFESLFSSTIKEYPDRKIFAIYGCPGKKALKRRQELSEIAGRYSKKVFVTEEDAGEESVMDISLEISRHVKDQGCECEIIVDREEAIRRAMAEADAKTVILLTGKGRETRQKRGTEYIDCPSDVDYVLQFCGEPL